MTNSTVVNNSGPGAAILASSSNTNWEYIYNSIIALNSSGNIGTTIEANLNNITSGDPLLGPLANNGGPTLTHAILPGSPALNGGNATYCPATDQRGISRPQPAGTNCDIGAYESDPPDPGAALHFDGIDDYVTLGNWMNFEEFTVEMWVRPGSTQNSTPVAIIDNNHSSYVNWVFQQIGMNEPYCFGVNECSYVTLIPDSWQYVALIKTTNGRKVYLNGVLVDSDVTGFLNYTNEYLYIGRWGWGGRYWKGTIDDLRIWNFERTIEQIFDNMSCEIDPNTSGLIAYYQFNEGIASENNAGVINLPDLAGGDHNGTLYNFALNGNTSNWVSPGGVVTGSNCTSSCTVTAEAGSNVTICPGAGTLLDGSYAGSDCGGTFIYEWYISGETVPFATTKTVTVTPAATTTYMLRVYCSSETGCEDTDDIIVTVEDTDVPVLTVPVGSDLGCNPTSIPTEADIEAASSAMDNCTVTIDVVAGSVTGDCDKTQTFTVTATDSGNNTDVDYVTYTWTEDPDKPVISTTAASGPLGCNPMVVPPAFTVDDECDPTAVVTVNTGGQTGSGCSKTQTWTAIYSNACWTSDPVEITYTWTEDPDKPVISTTAVSGALGCNPTVVPPVFTVNDECDPTAVVTVNTGGATGSGCSKTQTWTATYSNACWTSAPVEITYTWTEDPDKPVISTTAVSGALGCNPTVTPPVFTVDDECDPSAVVTVNTAGVTGTGCTKSQTWTATYSNACWTSDPVEITYTWTEDPDKPAISTMAVSGALGCNPTVTPPVFTVDDECDPSAEVTVNTVGATGSGCSKTQTWTATYSNTCWTSDPVEITYTWTEDPDKPAISTTAVSGALGCNPMVVAPVFTVDDECDPSSEVTVNTVGATGSGCSKTQTWTATYSNACWTSDPVEITYTWTEDPDKPAISTTAVSGALGCNPTVTPPVFTVDDECDPTAEVTVNTVGATGSGCSKTQTWTATYSNACWTSDPVEITYTWKEDLTKPVISTTATSHDLGCNPTVTPPEFTASDNCDGVLTPLVTSDGPENTSGCLWSQTWTANVNDLCGNAADAVSITYTWKEDLTKPVISTTATSHDLGCNPTVTPPEFTASDNCDGVLTPLVTSDGPENTSGCLWSQTWTANVNDLCGNAADAVSITYSWTIDPDKPVINPENSNSYIGYNPTPQQIEEALGEAEANDNCDGVLIPDVEDGQIQENGCDRSKTRTWNVADGCGNDAIAKSVTVSWKVDLTEPDISGCPSDITVYSESADGQSCSQIADWAEPTAIDNCIGIMTFTTRNYEPGTVFNLGQTEVIYSYVDDANNIAECSFNVTVVDNTPPILTAPENQVINVISCTGAYVIEDPISDNCTLSTWGYTLEGATTGTVSGIPDGTNSSAIAFNKGTTTIKLSGIDASNNIATEQTFTVKLPDYKTIQDGTYTDPGTWEGGCVPPNVISDGVIVVIEHNLTNPAGNTITNNGKMISTGEFINSGIYQGKGFFEGNFTNNGLVRPGNQ